MPKMKTKSAAAKRFKTTKSGKIKRKQAYTSHLAPNKTTKQKRHLRKDGLVHKTDFKRIKQLIAK
ncbi:50S ribosomal protein L35 [Mycoplasmoides gallisepticum]|uniref:Large ribosomal subunit protein bL35 n=5 Tax=Mycoplasmatota TaxID=544448 RepID=RL35_MYCGA|nr:MULTISPECIES: 50S ribosomal protein L35 [Mycoplasmatota]Q7NBC1.2 RecName: Full=Large ribosomal subunit protein bL35; AltName: Full=50S ribosomal protein L35 [Mycoplasmoides gallisepticum str. R(low)]AAP56708.2 50S ribosomal protein L35 [Mycoplasmoides gallisepticum str. R(low)]ADC30561.1 50S ribosomal protein L35 [Mycoplasmoides gallisepticum str. R(high)]ADC31405.1 50S ribosomal protein L35 [Mycoplasmoides gallisepticum str. F]AFP75942.1 50S ribosomal protein L35 [Mycoplasmoides gallisepti